jgi:hypothetical protein
MNQLRSIDEVAETLQNAKSRGKGCTLLIGAGCSVKAGIPNAAGLVQVIKERYPRAYQRAQTKTYARCMSELLLSERRDLIAEYVDQAKINWAHLCIALLVQAGYVDPSVDTLNPATDRHFKTGHHGRGVRDGSGLSHSSLWSQIGLHFRPPAPRSALQHVGVMEQAIE